MKKKENETTITFYDEKKLTELEMKKIDEIIENEIKNIL